MPLRQGTSLGAGRADRADRPARPPDASQRQGQPSRRPPRADVVVRVEASLPLPYGSEWLARTADDGTYSLNVLPERAYIVAVEDDSSGPRRAVRTWWFARAPRDGLDFALFRARSMRGRVTDVVDGKPAAGALVALIEEGPLFPKEFRTGLRSGSRARP